MGTLIMLICKFVLGLDSMGGDYQTIALTASIDTLAVIAFLGWRKGCQTA
ncbi:MAG: hypothetical protein HY609_05760 [Deltaproteobacteria bacterium]|nr:hypothetical protein [Deltaproteobacteria bacterium]MBI4224421.1 hypothetical protein [Deltaproteobacteria bacterium]